VPLLVATPDDLPFLRAMLAEAAFPPGAERPPDPLGDDHVARYLDGWGRPGDVGLVAWEDGRPVGAAWTRLLLADRAGYGFVDGDTPELSVAVAEGARGRGLGRALVVGALDLAAAHGWGRVSLSVALANDVAVGLYRALGFADVAPDGTSMTMVAPSGPAPPSTASASAPGSARVATEADGPALVRLRQVMFGSFGLEVVPTWVGPFLAAWAEEGAAGRWLATVVDGADGRPVASALALVHRATPGPGRTNGRAAHIGSVATEPAWRRRGAARAAVTALVDRLDTDGVESTTLNASADGAELYRSLGFATNDNLAMRRPRPHP
jgi:ribosomal protein S18 acetylase RimI-like enzyme